MYQKTNRKDLLIYVICIFVSYVYRLLYCIKYPVNVRDAYVYQGMINEWIENGTISKPDGDIIPPLPIYVIKIAHQLLGIDIFYEGKGINIFCSIICTILMIGIAKYVFKGRLYMLATGLFFSTNKMIVSLSCELLRESMYLLFIIYFIYINITTIKQRNGKIAILSGMAIACAFLSRTESLEILLLGLPLISLLTVFNYNGKWIKEIVLMGTSILSLILNIFFLCRIMNIPLSYFTTLEDYIN